MLLELLSTGGGTTDFSDKVDTKNSPKQFHSSDTVSGITCGYRHLWEVYASNCLFIYLFKFQF